MPANQVIKRDMEQVGTQGWIAGDIAEYKLGVPHSRAMTVKDKMRCGTRRKYSSRSEV